MPGEQSGHRSHAPPDSGGAGDLSEQITDGPTDDSDQTVTHCLQCGYWLRGLAASGRCPECGRHYDKYGGVWRFGKTVVVARGVALPRRCIKCNQAVEAVNIKRKLYWHPSWVYVLLFPLCLCYGVGVLLYMVVAALLSRKATVMVGLCSHHRRRRRLWTAVCWLLFATAALTLWLAVIHESAGLALAAGGLLVALAIVVHAALHLVTARRIDDRLIWLSGARGAFLAGLPEFGDRAEP